MTIRDILRVKGPNVVSTTPGQPVREALRLLVQHNIGALLVMEQGLEGIITERDILRAAADDPRRLETATVRDLMTTDVVTTTLDAEIHQVMDTITERRIRHLPVLQGGQLAGIVSIGDVVNALRDVIETENRQLQAYIVGARL